MRRDEVKRPSTPAVLIGLIPFAGMCLSVALWDRIYPRVLGIPFNLFWLASWIVLSSGCMALADYVEKRRNCEGDR
jgi:Protein of unknown function (DUF3311)